MADSYPAFDYADIDTRRRRLLAQFDRTFMNRFEELETTRERRWRRDTSGIEAYEASVEAKVYERMISERKRIAQKIRSMGQGEKAKIEGKINKDLQEIESGAYRKAQEIKGGAEGRAIRIYASSMNADPEFYEFIRTMDAYKKSIPAESTLILSTDSEFLKKLRRK